MNSGPTPTPERLPVESQRFKESGPEPLAVYGIPPIVHTEKHGENTNSSRPFLAWIESRTSSVRWGSGGISLVSTEESKASTTLPGKVEKVIRPHPYSGEPEKAQIAVEGADHLYREIRVPNTLTDSHGQKVKLKEGTEVEVKIEADPGVTKTAPETVAQGTNPPGA